MAATGQEMELKPGEALTGTRFSSVTITADDMSQIKASKANSDAVLQWLTNLLFCRLNNN